MFKEQSRKKKYWSHFCCTFNSLILYEK